MQHPSRSFCKHPTFDSPKQNFTGHLDEVPIAHTIYTVDEACDSACGARCGARRVPQRAGAAVGLAI